MRFAGIVFTTVRKFLSIITSISSCEKAWGYLANTIAVYDEIVLNFAVFLENFVIGSFFRAADKDEKKKHIPIVDRTPVEPPPVIVAIVGPSKVSLIKNFFLYTIGTINTKN